MESTSVPVVEKVVEKHEVIRIGCHRHEAGGHWNFVTPPQGEGPKVDLVRFRVIHENGKDFARLAQPEDVIEESIWLSH